MCLFSNFKTCVCKDAFGRSHEINLVWKYLLLKYVYNDYIQKKTYTKICKAPMGHRLGGLLCFIA